MANSFEGLWIPKEILQNKELKPTEKIILAVITALAKDGRCTASNQYIADTTGLGLRTVARGIPRMEALGFIKTKAYRDEKKILHRNIYLVPVWR